jgi:hypothetical protein
MFAMLANALSWKYQKALSRAIMSGKARGNLIKNGISEPLADSWGHDRINQSEPLIGCSQFEFDQLMAQLDTLKEFDI